MLEAMRQGCTVGLTFGRYHNDGRAIRMEGAYAAKITTRPGPAPRPESTRGRWGEAVTDLRSAWTYRVRWFGSWVRQGTASATAADPIPMRPRALAPWPGDAEAEVLVGEPIGRAAATGDAVFDRRLQDPRLARAGTSLEGPSDADSFRAKDGQAQHGPLQEDKSIATSLIGTGSRCPKQSEAGRNLNRPYEEQSCE